MKRVSLKAFQRCEKMRLLIIGKKHLLDVYVERPPSSTFESWASGGARRAVRADEACELCERGWRARPASGSGGRCGRSGRGVRGERAGRACERAGGVGVLRCWRCRAIHSQSMCSLSATSSPSLSSSVRLEHVQAKNVLGQWLSYRLHHGRHRQHHRRHRRHIAFGCSEAPDRARLPSAMFFQRIWKKWCRANPPTRLRPQ